MEIKQDRALKTREKLITAGFEIMAARGYHNVTMDEVAREAGVSTGSAYRYFRNKKELFIGVLEFYYEHIEVFAGIEGFSRDRQMAFGEYLPQILDRFCEIHKKYYGFHEELEGLCHTDPEIGQLKRDMLKRAVSENVSRLPEAMRSTPHLQEKLYMAIQILEDYSHMMMQGPDPELDTEYMKETAVRLVGILLGKQ